MRSGRRLAIDVGKVRIGVAVSDFHSILASGFETVVREANPIGAVNRILEIVREIEPIEIYIGFPVSLSGLETESTRDAISFARLLEAQSEIPIRFIDERLTTITATNTLKLVGKDAKAGRKVIDQIAATVILEQAMELERLTGRDPGVSIGEIDE